MGRKKGVPDNLTEELPGMASLDSHPHHEEVDFRKAVEALAIKPRAGKLLLLTRKFYNVLLAEAQTQGADIQIYRAPLSRVCKLTDFDSKNMDVVKDHFRRMASTTVEWSTGAKGARRWGTTQLVGIEVIEEGNRCWVQWEFPAMIKDKLLAPNTYTRLSLKMQNEYRTSSGLALYEICMRYLDSPGKLTMRLPWEEWRPILTGVPDSELEGNAYKEYKYFKRDVLKPAYEEVNSKGHLQVGLIEHKIGRAVKEVQFSVERARDFAVLEDARQVDVSLIVRLQELGFTQIQAEKIYEEADEQKVRRTLDYVEERIRQSKPPIDNPLGYFKTALKNNYADAARVTDAPKVVKPAARTRKAAPTAPPRDQKPVAAPRHEELIKRLEEAWWVEQRHKALNNYESMGVEEQATRRAAFEASGQLTPLLTKHWKKDGLKNKLCAVSFQKWLVRDLKTPPELELVHFGLQAGLLGATQAAE